MPETWREIDLAAFQPMGRIAGKPDVTGKGANVLGSPRIAMTWLVNELSSHGIVGPGRRIRDHRNLRGADAHRQREIM